MSTNITPESMSRVERSVLLYAETTLVDYGGLMEGARLNQYDYHALDTLQAAGLLTWGRVPGRLLGQFVSRNITHWVEFTDAGWDLAHHLRRITCQRSRDASSNYKRFKAEVEQNQASESYYTDRINSGQPSKGATS